MPSIRAAAGTEWAAGSPARRNPLTARVMANRVWHWLFGAGLVRTTDNFGAAGEKPSHPELLDYLAARFMQENWSVKRLVREILLSRTYQLSSLPTRSKSDLRLVKADPENRLLGRMNRRRLDADAFAMRSLRTSGRLDLAAGGSTAPRRKNFRLQLRFDERAAAASTCRLSATRCPTSWVFDLADPSIVTGSAQREHGGAAGALHDE